MASTDNTYLAQAGLDLLIDEHVVQDVVEVFRDLNIEAGEDGEYDLDAVATAMHEEIALEIAQEEDEREKAEEKKIDDEVDDTIVMGDIDALISSIEERKQFEQVITDENKKQENDEIGANMVVGMDLIPNSQCRPKTRQVLVEAPPVSVLDDEQLQEYVENQRSANTVKRTKQVVGKFEEYMAVYHLDGRQMHTLDAHTLNNYMSNYLISVRRVDGSQYEPDTLTSIHRALDRHLKQKRYAYSVLTDPEFESTRAVLASRRKELKGQGKGNKPNRSDALSPEQLDKLWSLGIFGASNGKTLQNTIFFYLASGFGFRGCHESRQLKWGDVVTGTDDDGHQYLELQCERLTKTRQGVEGGHTRVYNPRVYANPQDDTRCPLMMFYQYRSRRPASMREIDSPFYLTPKQDNKPTDETWYKEMAMGINRLSKIMPSVAEAGQLDGKITNHSIRRTTCQNLLASDVPSTASIQLTGHKSVESLSHYATATKRQQKSMSMIATGQKRGRIDESMDICPLPDVLYPPPPPPRAAAIKPEEDTQPKTAETGEGGVLAATPHPMAGMASSAAGMLSGAHIAGAVTINFNYCPRSSQVTTQNDLDVVNNTQQ